MRILLAVLVFRPLSALVEVVTVDFVKVLNGNTDIPRNPSGTSSI